MKHIHIVGRRFVRARIQSNMEHAGQELDEYFDGGRRCDLRSTTFSSRGHRGIWWPFEGLSFEAFAITTAMRISPISGLNVRLIIAYRQLLPNYLLWLKLG